MKRKVFLPARIFTALVYIFLYAPIFVLIVFSFNSSNSRTVWSGFTLDWYARLFEDSVIMSSLYTTIAISILAAIISTVLGTAASIGFFNMKKRVRTPLMTINSIPLTNADIVTGVSLCLLFVAAFSVLGNFTGWINDTFGTHLPEKFSMGFGTLLTAHITFNVPYVILSVMPKLQQLDRNLMDAAQDLGCTPFGALWKVVIPEIMPGVVNGALIAFTMSIDDFVISYFTAGSTTQTLAMAIYSMTKKRVTPKINAISTLLFITVLTLLIIVNVRSSRQEAKRRQNLHK
ncbi:MAG: ABC transporter permease [Oscillospiraceae bacterium]